MSSTTPTPTKPLYDRCRALGLSHSELARWSGVSVRRIWEGRLSDGEIVRLHDALDSWERGDFLAATATLSRDEDGTVRLDGVRVEDL